MFLNKTNIYLYVKKSVIFSILIIWRQDLSKIFSKILHKNPSYVRNTNELTNCKSPNKCDKNIKYSRFEFGIE